MIDFIIGEPKLPENAKHVRWREFASSHIDRDDSLLPLDIPNIQPVIASAFPVKGATYPLEKGDNLSRLQ
jgi:hypothetical protein